MGLATSTSNHLVWVFNVECMIQVLIQLSLLTNESLRGTKFSVKAEGLESSNPETDCNDKFNAIFNQGSKDAWNH